MKIGIIGGSGLENPEILQDFKEIEVDTPFGKPSSPLITGKLNGIDIFIIARHGKKHQIPPTQVNNRANIFALKDKGCKFIISTTAVGSLKEEIHRGDFVVLDQFIDFTKQRKTTFFESFEFGALHYGMAHPFFEELRKKLIRACEELKFPFHKTGTVVTIEGPRFSSIAESKMFRQWGADIINMSIAPEVILANEAEVPYATIAMATDYDCWKQEEEPVSWDEIKKIMAQNSERVKQILMKVIDYFSEAQKLEDIKKKIRTVPDFPKPGIQFRDITTLFKDRDGMKLLTELLVNRYKDMKIDVVAGIESRGFIVGSILAEKLGTGFVPVRKKGKLPAETISEEYELEYGKDIVEIHRDSISPGQRVLLVDDLIATGGTALASCKLIEKLGGQVVECSFIVELPELKGSQKIRDYRYPVFSLVKFEGN
jgi:5'-methylthioadenosine phosphorylase